jgi:hypothetical protein
MKVYKNLLFLIMLIVISLSGSMAQWRGSFYVNQAYDSNPFRLPQDEESWVSTFDLGIQKNFESLSLSYTGSFSRFEEMMDRNYYWHQLALFGGSERTYWGIYANQRINNSGYEVYNYLSYNAYLNNQFNLGSINVYWAANLEISDYEQLNEIDNLKLSGSLRLNKTLPTRTTFILGGLFNYKKYLNDVQIESYQDTQRMLSVFNGPGKGFGGQSGYTVYTELEAPSVSQLVLWLRLAQSVTSTTGLALQYQSSIILSGINRNVWGISYGYNDESQIFDDPMGYESSSIGSEITQLLPMNLLVKGAFYYTKKNYASQGSYLDEENYDDTIFRNDTYKTFWISVQKTFPLSSANNISLVLRFNYQNTDNNSNSYWYNYNNQYTALALELLF